MRGRGNGYKIEKSWEKWMKNGESGGEMKEGGEMG